MADWFARNVFSVDVHLLRRIRCGGIVRVMAAIKNPPRKPEFVRVHKWVTARRIMKTAERVETIAGEVWARPGDWILRDKDGERHRMSDWEFRETYEPTNEEAKELWNEGV